MARIHHAPRRRCGVAARGARAAVMSRAGLFFVWSSELAAIATSGTTGFSSAERGNNDQSKKEYVDQEGLDCHLALQLRREFQAKIVILHLHPCDIVIPD